MAKQENKQLRLPGNKSTKSIVLLPEPIQCQDLGLVTWRNNHVKCQLIQQLGNLTQRIIGFMTLSNLPCTQSNINIDQYWQVDSMLLCCCTTIWPVKGMHTAYHYYTVATTIMVELSLWVPDSALDSRIFKTLTVDNHSLGQKPLCMHACYQNVLTNMHPLMFVFLGT